MLTTTKRAILAAGCCALAGYIYAINYARHFTPVEDAFARSLSAGLKELQLWALLNFTFAGGWLFVPFSLLYLVCLPRIVDRLSPMRRVVVAAFGGLVVSSCAAYITVAQVFWRDDGFIALLDIPGILSGALSILPLFAVAAVPLLIVLTLLFSARAEVTA